jgi:hypothetical protein
MTKMLGMKRMKEVHQPYSYKLIRDTESVDEDEILSENEDEIYQFNLSMTNLLFNATSILSYGQRLKEARK